MGRWNPFLNMYADTDYRCVHKDSKYISIIDASTQTTQGTSPLYKHVHADIYRPDCCCPHRHNTSRSLLRPHRHNTSCRSQMVIWPTSVTISYWLFLLPMEVAAHAVCVCVWGGIWRKLYTLDLWKRCGYLKLQNTSELFFEKIRLPNTPKKSHEPPKKLQKLTNKRNPEKLGKPRSPGISQEILRKP